MPLKVACSSSFVAATNSIKLVLGPHLLPKHPTHEQRAKATNSSTNKAAFASSSPGFNC